MTHYENMSIGRSLYMISIYDIMISLIENPRIKNMLDADYKSQDPEIMASFFDGTQFRKMKSQDDLKQIFISLYADEINLANAIGIFISNLL